MIDAATLRLRPILMTTGAMVLGAVPLALAHGAGAESRTQIGWVIVGGMAFGTLLTLFVVPTAYTLLAGAKVRRATRRGRLSEPPVARPGAAPTDRATGVPLLGALAAAIAIESTSKRGSLPVSSRSQRRNP